MNDALRLPVGSLALAASWFTLERGAVLAALLASAATAAFMTISALDLWERRRARRAAEAAGKQPPASP